MLNKDNLLFNNRPVDVLISMFENQEKEFYISMISKRLELGYAYSNQIIGIFFKMGLIRREVKGRTVYVSLTKKGLSIAKSFQNIRHLLNGMKTPSDNVELTSVDDEVFSDTEIG